MDSEAEVLAPTQIDYAERDAAMTELDAAIYDDKVPPAIHDAWGDTPDRIMVLAAKIVHDRIRTGLSGDCAELGEQMLAWLESEVRRYAREGM